MIIQTNVQLNIATIQVEGRIDTTNYNEFENAMNELFEQNIRHILLDCSALDYISSSGLRVFLTAQKHLLTIKGSLSLYALQPMIQEIFSISGFQSIFSIFPDLESAKLNLPK